MTWRDRETTYRAVEVLVVRTTADAVYLFHEGEKGWVPRSLILDGGEDAEAGDDIELEVEEWKLEELGW